MFKEEENCHNCEWRERKMNEMKCNKNIVKIMFTCKCFTNIYQKNHLHVELKLAFISMCGLQKRNEKWYRNRSDTIVSIIREWENCAYARICQNMLFMRNQAEKCAMAKMWYKYFRFFDRHFFQSVTEKWQIKNNSVGVCLRENFNQIDNFLFVIYIRTHIFLHSHARFRGTKFGSIYSMSCCW